MLYLDLFSLEGTGTGIVQQRARRRERALSWTRPSVRRLGSGDSFLCKCRLRHGLRMANPAKTSLKLVAVAGQEINYIVACFSRLRSKNSHGPPTNVSLSAAICHSSSSLTDAETQRALHAPTFSRYLILCRGPRDGAKPKLAYAPRHNHYLVIPSYPSRVSSLYYHSSAAVSELTCASLMRPHRFV